VSAKSIVLIFGTVMLVMSSALGQSSPHFRFTQVPGPERVGIKIVEQYDYSRVFRKSVDELGRLYTGERARPIQTLLWYPSEKTKGPAMTFGDYEKLRQTETDFSNHGSATEQNPSVAGLSPALGDQLWAVRDAPPKPGHFPVVIYAPSYSNVAWENADLCEYLASYGYLVLSSPDMGETSRTMTSDVAGAEAQARDIEFLISYAQSLPNADISALAVAGFSWGGLSNLFAASRDSRIKVLVALDGTMRYRPGLLKQAGYVHPDQMGIPLLYFTQGEISLEDQERLLDPSDAGARNPLNAWTHGDLMTVHMLAMSHLEFSSLYQRNEETWKSDAMLKADYQREDGITSYALVALYTLRFLDAYLKQDAGALAFLKETPSKNGVPLHFMSSSFRAGSGTPATLDAFRQELHRRGFEHAHEIYSSMQKQDPTFKLSEDVINQWGYQLLGGRHFPEAIEILKLNVELYPHSANTYDSLAEAYRDAGDKQHAIEFYTKSVEQDPSNENAKQKLKELQRGVDTTH
jgi:dienelactone hydrolase